MSWIYPTLSPSLFLLDIQNYFVSFFLDCPKADGVPRPGIRSEPQLPMVPRNTGSFASDPVVPQRNRQSGFRFISMGELRVLKNPPPPTQTPTVRMSEAGWDKRVRVLWARKPSLSDVWIIPSYFLKAHSVFHWNISLF